MHKKMMEKPYESIFWGTTIFFKQYQNMSECSSANVNQQVSSNMPTSQFLIFPSYCTANAYNNFFLVPTIYLILNYRNISNACDNFLSSTAAISLFFNHSKLPLIIFNELTISLSHLWRAFRLKSSLHFQDTQIFVFLSSHLFSLSTIALEDDWR